MALPVYTTSDAAADAMYDAFNAFWAVQPIRPKLTYDNIVEDAVDNDLTIVSSDPIVVGEGYVRIEVLHAAGQIAALGTKRHRQFGIFTAEVYAEMNIGRKRSAGRIADQALRFFQVMFVDGVTFQDPRINEVGNTGRWWQVNVLADFIYDLSRS